MKILITGASGFVGKYLIEELKKDPSNDIYGTVFNSSSSATSLLSNDHVFVGDLTDTTFTLDLIKKTTPDVIYHLAALSVVGSSVDKAISVMNTNTSISYSVLEAVRLYAPSARIVAICSANEYGAVKDTTHMIDELTPLRPLNPYAVSKLSQEMLALMYSLAYGLDIVIVRPFNHTGAGQTTDFVIPRLAQQFARIEKGEIPPKIEIGNTESVRDFTDVRDMVIAYKLAAELGKKGEIYNIGSGVGHTIKEVLDIFTSLSKEKVAITTHPDLVRSADVPYLIANAEKFKSLTAWEPTISLRDTIIDILNYYRRI